MKKIFSYFLMVAIVVMLSVLGTWAEAQSPAGKPPIRIGYMPALTGPFASYGLDSDKGVQLWIQETNKAGGIEGHKVELITYDTQSDATRAVLALKKVITIEKVHAIIGPSSTGEALAMGPVAEDAKIPLLAMTGSTVFDKQGWKFSFRANTSSENMVRQRVAAARLMGLKKIAVTYDLSGFGKALLKTVKEEAPKEGLEIVTEQGADVNATEFGVQLSAIKASGAQFIIHLQASKGGVLLVKQAREMGIQLPIAVEPPSLSQEYLSIPGVREAYSQQPAIYVTECYITIFDLLTADHHARIWGEKWNPAFVSKYGRRVDNNQLRGVNQLEMLRDAFARLFREKPDILAKGDIKVVSANLQEKLENMPYYVSTGTALHKFTPTDHQGYKAGSGHALCQWKDGKYYYLPNLSAPY